ncbi:unnamed protein product [Albugo candida]|uniref:Uncharacterized protein n=1 Tax=Albugo candida TaxID=65357 RepID=A0A024GJP9_9STRA|nr:unnamed protein product [Albugo candida]|eukprot:CCI47120.1 unnamed protein product [Albugo candida]
MIFHVLSNGYFGESTFRPDTSQFLRNRETCYFLLSASFLATFRINRLATNKSSCYLIHASAIPYSSSPPTKWLKAQQQQIILAGVCLVIQERPLDPCKSVIELLACLPHSLLRQDQNPVDNNLVLPSTLPLNRTIHSAKLMFCYPPDECFSQSPILDSELYNDSADTLSLMFHCKQRFFSDKRSPSSHS